MKVIDLLNKIANGENPPEIIKFEYLEYKYDYKEKNYYEVSYDENSFFYRKNFSILNKEIMVIKW